MQLLFDSLFVYAFYFTLIQKQIRTTYWHILERTIEALLLMIMCKVCQLLIHAVNAVSV